MKTLLEFLIGAVVLIASAAVLVVMGLGSFWLLGITMREEWPIRFVMAGGVACITAALVIAVILLSLAVGRSIMAKSNAPTGRKGM